jgi:hypothetical protein
MTPDDFRRIALRMDGAVEGAHMNHPDFRVHGKIFATLAPDGLRGMVTLTPGQQRECIAANPDAFEPASGAWGRQGCTMVRLASVDEETVGEAMTLAWQNSARAAAARSAKPRSSKTASRTKTAPRTKIARAKAARRPAARRRPKSRG